MSGEHDFSKACGYIKDLDALSGALDIPLADIEKHASDFDGRYRIKPIPKENGGERELNIPCDALKKIQRRINGRIFSTVRYPPYIFGGIRSEERGTDYIDVAYYHQGAAIAAKLDIKSYFPSISAQHIQPIFSDFFGFPPSVSNTLLALCIHDDELPQGAPTSVAIANLVFFKKEPALFIYCKKRGFKYSRFIDDIFISSKDIDADIDTPRRKAEKMIAGFDLKINEKKTVPRKKKYDGLRVFNILISSEKARITKTEVRQIRAAIQQLEKEARIPNKRKHNDYHRSWHKISGRLNKLVRLNHPKYKSYRKRMKAILPLMSERKIKPLIKSVENMELECEKIENIEAFKKSFNKKKNRIGVLKRSHPKTAEKLKSKMKQIDSCIKNQEH